MTKLNLLVLKIRRYNGRNTKILAGEYYGSQQHYRRYFSGRTFEQDG